MILEFNAQILFTVLKKNNNKTKIKKQLKKHKTKIINENKKKIN